MIFEYADLYRVELVLEEVSRKTDYQTPSTTIDELFTDRKVGIEVRYNKDTTS